MMNVSKKVRLMLAIMMIATVVLSGCAQATPEPKVVEKIVKETVEVEKIVKETVVVKETADIEKVANEILSRMTEGVEERESVVEIVQNTNFSYETTSIPEGYEVVSLHAVFIDYHAYGYQPGWATGQVPFHMDEVHMWEGTENDAILVCMEGPFLEGLLNQGACMVSTLRYAVPKSDTPPTLFGVVYYHGGMKECFPLDLMGRRQSLVKTLDRFGPPAGTGYDGIIYLKGWFADQLYRRGCNVLHVSEVLPPKITPMIIAPTAEPTEEPTMVPIPIRTLHTKWVEWVDGEEEAEYMSVMTFEWLNANMEVIPVTEEASTWEEHKFVPEGACYGRLNGDDNGNPWFSRSYSLEGENVEGDLVELNANGDTWFTVSRPKNTGSGSGGSNGKRPLPTVGPYVPDPVPTP